MQNAMNRRSFIAGAALAVGTLAAAPAAMAGEKGGASVEKPSNGGEVKLQVFAANSLEKALPEVQALYAERHPGVAFADTQFKASGDLVEQMKAGAVVDVLITASKGTMDAAEKAGLIVDATRVDMFYNDLVIVTAEGSKLKIADLAEVADASIASIAIGDAATVPAGKYANQALFSVGLYSDESGEGGAYAPEIADKIMLGDKVGTCASYVSTGDATVGFVYSSDVYRYDGIRAVYTTPEDSHKPIVYPGAVGSDAPFGTEAQDFLDFCMTDPDALDVWSEFGFEVVEVEEEASGETVAKGTDGKVAGARAGA